MHLRLGKLFANDIALAAYHLPLDAHPAHGNNALLAQALGVDRIKPLGDIGARGTLGEPVPLQTFSERLADAVGGRQPLVIAGGDHPVSSVGIVTGAGTDYMTEALAAGCDTFVTGEPAERAYGVAKDNSIHFLAGGHHATETFGVRRDWASCLSRNLDIAPFRRTLRTPFRETPNRCFPAWCRASLELA